MYLLQSARTEQNQNTLCAYDIKNRGACGCRNILVGYTVYIKFRFLVNDVNIARVLRVCLRPEQGTPASSSCLCFSPQGGVCGLGVMGVRML